MCYVYSCPFFFLVCIRIAYSPLAVTVYYRVRVECRQKFVPLLIFTRELTSSGWSHPDSDHDHVELTRAAHFGSCVGSDVCNA